MSNWAAQTEHPVGPAIRVETVRNICVPDPLAWRKGFICGFVSAAATAAGLITLMWRI